MKLNQAVQQPPLAQEPIKINQLSFGKTENKESAQNWADDTLSTMVFDLEQNGASFDDIDQKQPVKVSNEFFFQG